MKLAKPTVIDLALIDLAGHLTPKQKDALAVKFERWSQQLRQWNKSATEQKRRSPALTEADKLEAAARN